MAVRDVNGDWKEPNVWDIDDSELTPAQKVGNGICMLIALGFLITISPLFLVLLLRRKENAEVDSSLIQSSLSRLQDGKGGEQDLQIMRDLKLRGPEISNGESETTKPNLREAGAYTGEKYGSYSIN